MAKKHINGVYLYSHAYGGVKYTFFKGETFECEIYSCLMIEPNPIKGRYKLQKDTIYFYPYELELDSAIQYFNVRMSSVYEKYTDDFSFYFINETPVTLTNIRLKIITYDAYGQRAAFQDTLITNLNPEERFNFNLPNNKREVDRSYFDVQIGTQHYSISNFDRSNSNAITLSTTHQHLSYPSKLLYLDRRHFANIDYNSEANSFENTVFTRIVKRKINTKRPVKFSIN